MIGLNMFRSRAEAKLNLWHERQEHDIFKERHSLAAVVHYITMEAPTDLFLPTVLRAYNTGKGGRNPELDRVRIIP